MSNRDLIPGLPPIHADFFDVVYQESPSSKKRFTRTLSFALDAEMHDALEALYQNSRLPFLTNRGTMMRHASAAFIESMKSFLTPELQTTWSRLHNQQRRITNETYARLIDENLEADIVNLTFITSAREWKAVADHLAKVRGEIAGLSEPVWRAHAARGWAGAMKGLKVAWATEMDEDAPQQWRRVRELLEWFDDAARF